MTLHWHNVNVNKMSTLLKFASHQHRGHCDDIFCWRPMYPNVSLDETVFIHIAVVGNNHFVHCHVTGRRRQVSTAMFCESFILIFQQVGNILNKWKCLSMSVNKYITHVLWLFSFIFNKSKLLVECQRPNVMRLMSWHLTQNVMRFGLWDGKPVSWLKCHEIWRMSWDLSSVWWGPDYNDLKKHRQLLLYYIKLCSSFQNHRWIQTGVTARKHSIWVKIGDIFSRVKMKFDGWPCKTIGHLFYTMSSLVHHFKAMGELKLKLQSENPLFG